MSAQDNIQTVKNFYAAQKGGDQGAMLKCCAENVRVVLDTAAGGIPWSGEYEGHADLEAEQRLMAEFLQIDAFEQLDFLASETKVAVVSKIEVTVKKRGSSSPGSRLMASRWKATGATGILAVTRSYARMTTPLWARSRRSTQGSLVLR